MEKEKEEKKGFWYFVNNNPVCSTILALTILSHVANIVITAIERGKND